MTHPQLVLLHHYLTVGALVFGLGLMGFLARRNMIVMFLSAEIMLQGIAISLVAWGRFHNDWGGQMLVTFMLAVAASEAAIALALVLMLFRHSGSLDMFAWQTMREANQQPYVDEDVPEEIEGHKPWPRLTPAGVQPEPSEEDLWHRSQV
jgi:NADH-quinone oxidoreductase subunit K